MTSSSAAQQPTQLSPSPQAASAETFSLTEPVCAVVQLAHQAPGVVHQVVLDPAKVKGALIRLGEWPGDEAHGWQYQTNVAVLAVLGRAALVEGKVQVTPLADDTASA